MFTDERRNIILDLLKQEGRVLAKELAERFEMSIDSIRRDLTIMEEKGLLKRTHGGAIPMPQSRNAPVHPSLRYSKGTPHQNAIARAAASFIQEKDAVFIGGASIHYSMLQYVPQFPFTVVTNSLATAEALKDQTHVDVYLIGGMVKSSGNITDAIATSQIKQFALDICFLTGGGISTRGISTSTPEVAAFGQAVAEVSRRTIGLAPHEKLGIDYFAKIGPISLLDLLITDEEASREDLEAISAHGIEVITAHADVNKSSATQKG